MKALLRRKVRIVGRAVPIWVVASVIAVAALAWAVTFLSLWHVTGTTAGGAPSFAWQTPMECVIAAGPGSATCTLHAQNGLSSTVSGVDDTSVLWNSVRLNNTSTVPIYACWSGGGAAYVTLEPQGPNAGSYGPIVPAAVIEVALRHFFTGLTSGIGIDYNSGWTISASPCP